MFMEFRAVAIVVPEMYVGAGRNKGKGCTSNGIAILGKHEQVIVDIIAVIEWDILVFGFRAPNLGRNVNHE
jgi:hypothetical protein